MRGGLTDGEWGVVSLSALSRETRLFPGTIRAWLGGLIIANDGVVDQLKFGRRQQIWMTGNYPPPRLIPAAPGRTPNSITSRKLASGMKHRR